MDDPKRKYVSKPVSHRAMAPVWSVIGLAIAYWIWPDGIEAFSLAEAPLEKVLRIGASLLVGVATVAFAVRLWLDE